MIPRDTIEPESLALRALAATLADERRAERLLTLTGLTPDELRARAGEPSMLAACLAFLEAHEPDLLAVADAIGERPEALVAARETLER
ncbi:DUF3572 family protein [Sphingomicrobium nitratireducens]|uniref:DUF3572 family protein n=1 Tax=Sphingomicrobium nitratireducens TaxID=2964666 RepID=UPI00223F12EF|nr:DUF3572 family protein [Sphingomicrobium nitratireducens]